MPEEFLGLKIIFLFLRTCWEKDIGTVYRQFDARFQITNLTFSKWVSSEKRRICQITSCDYKLDTCARNKSNTISKAASTKLVGGGDKGDTERIIKNAKQRCECIG